MTETNTTKTARDLPLEDRIEETFDKLSEARAKIDDALELIRSSEERVKTHEDNIDDYQKAKSNEVRQTLVASWLSDDTEYDAAREHYREGRRGMRLAAIEVQRLRLLVDLRTSA